MTKLHPAHQIKGPFLPATCIHCGHPGRSKRPHHYQCSGCYYAARAEANEVRATELRTRAAKLNAEAVEFRMKSQAFRRRQADQKET